MARVPTKTTPDVDVQRGLVVFQNVQGANDPDAFGAGVGRAISGLGAQIGAQGAQLATAEKRIQDRRATISRIKRKGVLSNELFSHFNNVNLQEDITDPNVIQQAGERAKQIVDQSVFGNFDEGASVENSLIYEAEAQTLLNKFNDDLVKKSMATSKGLVDEAMRTAINEGATLAQNNPEDILNIMDQGAQTALISLSGAIDIEDEGVFVRKYQAQAARSAIDSLFLRGATDPGALNEAMATLAHPSVQAVLTPETSREFFKRKSNIGTPPRILTTDETAKTLRLDPEVAAKTIVQVGPKGTMSILLKPETDNQIRNQKIEAAMKAGASEIDATDTVDGNVKIILVPETGEVLRVNRRTGDVKVLTRAQPQPTNAEDQPESAQVGLYQRIKDTPTTGIVGFGLEAFSGTIGQIPGVPIAEETIKVRQDVRSALNTMVQAFILNERFPVGLVKLIREDIKIEASIFDSDRALLIRLQGIDKKIRTRIQAEQRLGDNVSIPRDRREAAKIAVVNMQNFLDELDVPQDEDANAPEDPPIHILTPEQYNALPSGTRYIHPNGTLRRKK